MKKGDFAALKVGSKAQIEEEGWFAKEIVSSGLQTDDLWVQRHEDEIISYSNAEMAKKKVLYLLTRL